MHPVAININIGDNEASSSKEDVQLSAKPQKLLADVEWSVTAEWQLQQEGGNGMFHGMPWWLLARELLTTLTSFNFCHIFCSIVGASMPENLFRT